MKSIEDRYSDLITAISELSQLPVILSFVPASALVLHEIVLMLGPLTDAAAALELDLRNNDHDGDTQPNNEKPEQPPTCDVCPKCSAPLGSSRDCLECFAAATHAEVSRDR